MSTERTQMYLDRTDYAWLKAVARARGVSAAQVAREALHEYLMRHQHQLDAEGERAFNSFVGAATGRKRASTAGDALYRHTFSRVPRRKRYR